MEQPIIEAEGLVKHYGETVAVDGVGLQVAHGVRLYRKATLD